MSEQKTQRPTLDQAIQQEACDERSAYEVALDSIDKKDRDAVLASIKKHRAGELGLKSWRALSRAIVKAYGFKVNVNHFANYIKGL